MNMAILLATLLTVINPKPATIPEVRHWEGREGFCSIKDTTALRSKEARKSELGEEGYEIDISKNGVKIIYGGAAGKFYAANTLKQIRRLNPEALPCGKIVDKPRYKIRGFVLDVGRLPVPVEFLYEVVDIMADCKMNDLQLHLNDNYIWHSDFAKQGKDPFKESYAAFRLESKIPGLTAKDVSYTKKDFAKLVVYAAKKGVRIVPEFDSPGHALALTRVRPDLIYQGPMSDPSKRCEMLDAAKPEALDFVCSLYDEYWPLFKNCEVVHIGSDEFFGANEDYRRFVDGLLAHVQKNKHTPRLWGSLRRKAGSTPVRVDGVQMNIWSQDWGRAKESIELGYDIINTFDRDLYFVPTADYYRMDRNLKRLWENWRIHVIGPDTLDIDEPKLLGASWACWNDMIGPRHNGYTYKDLKPTIKDVCETLCDRMWTGEGPKRSYNEQQELIKKLF